MINEKSMKKKSKVAPVIIIGEHGRCQSCTIAQTAIITKFHSSSSLVH